MATAKTLRIIRPSARGEPVYISLPGLNQVQYVQIQEDVPNPVGYEEVSSNQVVESILLYGSDSEDSGISEEHDKDGYRPIRKRQRLDHMSLDDKIQRRKMKNRVAAQTARDKKKAKMDELEDIVRNLQKKNRQLELENQRLQTANEKLLEENSRLFHNQTSQPQATTCSRKANRGPSQNLPFESAAFINVPQQKGQGKNWEGTMPSILTLHVFLALLSVLAKVAVRAEESKKKELSLTSPMTGYRLYLMMSATVYYSGLCRALKNRPKPPDPRIRPRP